VTKLICVENTHNRGGGSIYPLEKMAEIYRLAKSKALLVHLDGARLWNASVATGIKPHEYSQFADSVSVCLSKGLGAPIGSLVAGSPSFIDRVHRFRKMFGGGMRQGGIIASAGIYALDHHFERLKDDHQNAKRLAVGLKELKGISIDPKQVETNIVIFDVTDTGMTGVQMAEAMKREGVLIHAFGKTQIRLVTHLDVSAEEIEKVLKVFKKVLGKKN
jgi:threonine aldolase